MPPSPGSPDSRASHLWDEGTVRTEHAGRVRELRAPGPGVMSALPGMAYLCRFDDDWTMDFVSAGAEDLTGHPPEAFLAGGSVRYADVIHPEDRQRVADEVGRAVECDRSFRLEYRIRTADGRERWVLEAGHPVRDLQGELLAIEGFVQDLTERRDLELQLRHAQKMEAVGRVAGGLAHDFNNLLTVIGSNAQFLVEDLMELDVTENVREEAREVARAAKLGADLTAQLLAFARKQPHSPRIQSVNCLVQECQGIMARLLGPGVTLSLRLAPELPAARLDRGQMEQVLMNLAANARDAMPGGGAVTVETMSLELEEPYATKRVSLERGAWVLLALSDDGDGMPPDLLENVFEPFFTTKEEGTGLGLATVFGIVKQHQGHVSVYSEPGSGTTFKIYLPATDAAEDGSTGAGAPEEEGAGALQGSETVLLVEDDSVVHEMAVATLEQFGYTALSATDAATARDLGASDEGRAARLAVIDLVLEGESGVRVAEKLRELSPDLLVLFTSGFPGSALVDRQILDEDAPFIQKPFTPRGLLERVRGMLDEAGPRDRG